MQGRYQDRNIAVKRCKISKSGDLLSFRQQVALMAQLHHPHAHPGVVQLFAVRALPPGNQDARSTL